MWRYHWISILLIRCKGGMSHSDIYGTKYSSDVGVHDYHSRCFIHFRFLPSYSSRLYFLHDLWLQCSRRHSSSIWNCLKLWLSYENDYVLLWYRHWPVRWPRSGVHRLQYWNHWHGRSRRTHFRNGFLAFESKKSLLRPNTHHNRVCPTSSRTSQLHSFLQWPGGSVLVYDSRCVVLLDLTNSAPVLRRYFLLSNIRRCRCRWAKHAQHGLSPIKSYFWPVQWRLHSYWH